MAYTHGIGFSLALVLAATPAMAQPAQVTPDEYRLLVRGEITEGQRVGGGLLGTFIGFGSGHLVQQRWGEKGWIFTVGESISYAFFLAGVIDCMAHAYGPDGQADRCNDGYIFGGIIAFAALRIWEAVDVWAYPPDHNRRVRELRARVYGPAYYQQYQQPPPPPPVYMRAVDGGFTGGITVRF